MNLFSIFYMILLYRIKFVSLDTGQVFLFNPPIRKGGLVYPS